MPSPLSPSRTAGLALECAQAVLESFDAWHEGFRASARRAARHFVRRDWPAARDDAAARLLLYTKLVDHARDEVTRRAGGDTRSRILWMAMCERYAALVQGRVEREIAETFFSSVSRRHLRIVGVVRGLEFLRPWVSEPRWRAADAERRRCSGDAGHEAIAAALLDGTGMPLADRDGDVRRLGAALADRARDAWGNGARYEAEILAPVFYRNQGAYLVGRLTSGDRALPLVVALAGDQRGVGVDALLTTADEMSVVFGFAWSYFHVDVESPAATVAFLHELMPLKRVDELYTAIGYNKHGKTELFRRLAHELSQPEARFEDAEGAKGLVMAVFTLPALNIVLKIIKDRIAAPKRTTRHQVAQQYRRVFLRDRVGRLADAQLFEGLEFRRACFSDVLMAELLAVAPSVVQPVGDHVLLQHLYTERRVRPLNLYVREASAADAEAAIVDYGEAIRELAVANIFPGDLLLKNFGVTRHGRVIFYDYDELATLDECRFRALPPARTIDEELAAEPWFSVAPHDVFPEEFMPYLVPAGPLRDVFLEAHRDLLDPEWWCAVQERIAAGEVVDTFPYAQHRRLRR